MERLGGGECKDIDVIESLVPGRLLQLLACTTAGAVPTKTGGDFGRRMGQTPGVGARMVVALFMAILDVLAVPAIDGGGGVLVASKVVLVENVIFLIRVDVVQMTQFHSVGHSSWTN